MRAVAELGEWADRQWRLHWPKWLADRAVPSPAPDGTATGPIVASWGLRPPTEQAMAADPDAVASWVGQWQAMAAAGRVELDWVVRTWRAFGVQRLPHRAGLRAEQVAALAAHDQTQTWCRATQAVDQLRLAWPDADLSPTVPAVARGLGALDEADLVRLLAVLGWIVTHPESELWERELPVPDVDTKWLERHRGLVAGLAEAVVGAQGVGLRRHGQQFRVRLLDPSLDLRLTEFSVDLAGLRKLQVRPGRVLISENLTPVATLPELSGTVAIHGQGIAAPTLAEVEWIAQAEQWYWGDLDTWGLLILGRVRATLPGVRSVLMDVETFDANQVFAVREPTPFRGEIGHLTMAELAALALVRDGDRRLEQERIPREYVRGRLVSRRSDHGFGS